MKKTAITEQATSFCFDKKNWDVAIALRTDQLTAINFRSEDQSLSLYIVSYTTVRYPYTWENIRGEICSEIRVLNSC